MKKILPFLIILSFFCFNQPMKASAQFADTIGGFIAAASWPTELVNSAITSGKAIASVLLEGALQAKEYIYDPLAKIMGNAALDAAKASALNWVNSGFKGNPAFISNPDVYFKNMATGVVRTNVIDIGKSNNLFGGSVASYLIKDTRGKQAPLSERIAPTLPSAIQNNVCTDESLTSQAKKQIDSGLSVGGAQDIDTVKSQLRTKFNCGGTLSKTQQRDVNDCFATDFNCGGWGAWLDLTSNPNNTLTGQIIAANTATAQTQTEKLAKEESITTKGGTLAIKGPCLDTPVATTPNSFYTSPTAGAADTPNNFYVDPTAPVADAPNDFYADPTTYSDANNPNKSPCQNEEVATPATAVENQASNALSGDWTNLANVHEAGDYIAGAISGALGGLMGSGFSSLGGNGQKMTLDTIGNTTKAIPKANTTITNATQSELTPKQKDGFIKKINMQMNTNIATANGLKTTDNSYLGTINAYEAKLTSLSNCYTQAVSISSSYSTNDPRLIAGMSYVSGRSQIYNAKKQELNAEVVSANATLSGINSVKTDLAKVSSASEMTNVFDDYQNKITDGTYVSDQDYANRQIEYVTEKPKIETDPTLDSHITKCNQLKVDATAFADTSDNIASQLSSNLTTMNNFKTMDNSYLSIINTYDTRLASLSTCYDAAVLIYPTFVNTDIRFINGKNYISTKTQVSNTTKPILNNEIIAIDKTVTGIAAVQQKLSSIQFFTSMNIAIDDYNSKISSNYYLNFSDYMSRKNIYDAAKPAMESDYTLDDYVTGCNRLKTDATTALNAATALDALNTLNATNLANSLATLATTKATAAGLITANAPEGTTSNKHVKGSLATLKAAQLAANATSASTQSTVDAQIATLNTAINTYIAAVVP